MSAVKRPRLAAITTEFRPLSHADVILSRWKTARPADAVWGWRGSQCDIVSLFAAQTPTNDMAAAYCEQERVTLSQSIAEALTLGGPSLAVDGVLLIAEHGDYPWNENQQKLYPRREFFDEIVAVFRASGHAVPLFLDKHLSWNSQSARAMAAIIGELQIPFLSGSSLPYVGFRPALPLPAQWKGATLLSLFPGGAESYGYHSIEIALRALAVLGREAQPAQVTVWRGAAVWQQIETRPDWRALAAAILPATTPFDDIGSARDAPKTKGAEAEELLFCLEFENGTRSLHLRVADGVGEFGSALQEQNDLWTGRVAAGGADDFYAHFATQNALIEKLMLTGHSSVPLARSLCSTLLINSVMESLATPGQKRPVSLD